MANEIQAQAPSGLTLYAVLLNSTGQIWNGSAFVTINGANWTSYDLAMTEAAAGIYLASMPAVVAGAYQFVVYQQPGASPAVTDTQRDTGSLAWDGSTVTASAGSYTSTALVKSYLGITDTDDDTLIGLLVTRARAQVDAWTGRTFAASVASNRYFDAVRDVAGAVLWLDWDLCSISTITNGDGSVLPPTAYVTEPRNATPYYGIKLKASQGYSWTYGSDPENAITVNGLWAYSASAPDDVVQATTRLAAYLFKQKDSPVFDTTAIPALGQIIIPRGMPADVVQLLAPYRKRK